MLWLTGGALVVCVAMVLGLFGWIAMRALPSFWPSEVVALESRDGQIHIGEVARVEPHTLSAELVESLPEDVRASIRVDEGGAVSTSRTLVRTGNYDLFESHYRWIDDLDLVDMGSGVARTPAEVAVVERMEWGRFYGFPTLAARIEPLSAGDESGRRAEVLERAAKPGPAGAVAGAQVARSGVDGASALRFVRLDALHANDRVLAFAWIFEGSAAAWTLLEEWVPSAAAQRERIAGLRQHEVGAVSARLESARLRRREAELEHQPSPAWVAAYDELRAARSTLDPDTVERAQKNLENVERDFGPAPAGFLRAIEAAESVERAAEAEFAVLIEQIAEIEARASRDVVHFATSAEGVEKTIRVLDIVRAYPANRLSLLGRVGIYLSRWGEFLSGTPREANNEGGVFPAIFGTVLMTLLMCLVVVPLGVLAALYLREYAKDGPWVSLLRIAVNNLAGVPSIVFGVFGLGFFCYIVGASIDDLFYEARLPQPTFGKSGLIWASLTLALLTAPVVIVATEEALSAVPRSIREGSYACGAGQWQTLRRVVLPQAMPGILTGAILAMARGAGEVAPLMLVGAVKLAPELPFALEPPFGVNRSFMHLGFHIYDLGFQSQNSEAAKPMVYTTALLLIVIVVMLNVVALMLRARLRRRAFHASF
jgi:phosphate ABC transporter permease subunit PstA